MDTLQIFDLIVSLIRNVIKSSKETNDATAFKIKIADIILSTLNESYSSDREEEILKKVVEMKYGEKIDSSDIEEVINLLKDYPPLDDKLRQLIDKLLKK